MLTKWTIYVPVRKLTTSDDIGQGFSISLCHNPGCTKLTPRVSWKSQAHHLLKTSQKTVNLHLF